VRLSGGSTDIQDNLKTVVDTSFSVSVSDSLRGTYSREVVHPMEKENGNFDEDFSSAFFQVLRARRTDKSEPSDDQFKRVQTVGYDLRKRAMTLNRGGNEACQS
jgi:hypothetical protein